MILRWIRKGGTHVRAVEGVRELNSVTGGSPHVDLLLRDELGAVEVVLLRDEGLRLDQDIGVRVRDTGWNP